MPWITILPLGKKIEVPSGTVLLDAIRQADIEIASPCNGRQMCGKCKVRIREPLPSSNRSTTSQSQKDFSDNTEADESDKLLTPQEWASGIRLACRVVIREDMWITLPEDYALGTRILEGDRIKNTRVAPAVAISDTNGRYALCYRHREPVPMEIWQSAFSPKGIAIDLGTTTLVVTLMDLRTGAELATASALNPQIRFGHDVVTRIHKASTNAGLMELFKLISNGLNTLVEETCLASATHRHEIVDAVIGGNTTMLQIAAGMDPSPLGQLPFTVGMQSGCTYPASRFGLNLNPQARIYVPPVAHAFVGSDISAGLLSIGFFKSKQPALFIDMGTNGEMAVTANGRIMVTSTAIGPAFEGMGITHGMRAASGAIETVWTNGKYINIRTIDNAPAKGICGSGIMDMMACLISLDAVESGGRLKKPRQDTIKPGLLGDRYRIRNRTAAIQLTEHIYFTQKDIRQFQLAKSAIQTGIQMLLAMAAVDLDRLEKIVIAGGFGYHLRASSLQQTGLIPRHFKGRTDFAGNTSRTGCARMLVDATARDYIQQRMKTVSHVSIAENPDFQSTFVRHLALDR